MKTIELLTADKPLSAYAEEFSQNLVVLTLHGEAIATVSSIKDIDPESLSLSTNPEFIAIIQKARDEFTAVFKFIDYRFQCHQIYLKYRMQLAKCNCAGIPFIESCK